MERIESLKRSGGLITEMKFLYFFALLIVLFVMVHSLKVRKPKKETVYVQLPPDVPGGQPRYVKAPKVMTEYDKCKMECKRQRDAQYRKEHIAALREELAILEAQEAAEVTAGAPETQQGEPDGTKHDTSAAAKDQL